MGVVVRPWGHGGPVVVTPEQTPQEPPDVAQLDALLRTHGAVWLKGFGLGLQDFSRLSRALMPQLRKTPLERVPHPLHRDVETVTKGTQAQNWHAEYSHLPHRTARMAFASEVPGAPLHVVDGVALVDALPQWAVERLTGRNLCFTSWHPAMLWQAVLGTSDVNAVAQQAAAIPGYKVTFNPDGSLHAALVVPALHRDDATGRWCLCNNLLPGAYAALAVTWEGGAPVEEDLLRAVQVSADANRNTTQWSAGDAVWLDNQRCMHARDAQPSSRRHWMMQGWPRNPKE